MKFLKEITFYQVNAREACVENAHIDFQVKLTRGLSLSVIVADNNNGVSEN